MRPFWGWQTAWTAIENYLLLISIHAPFSANLIINFILKLDSVIYNYWTDYCEKNLPFLLYAVHVFSLKAIIMSSSIVLYDLYIMLPINFLARIAILKRGKAVFVRIFHSCSEN